MDYRKPVEQQVDIVDHQRFTKKLEKEFRDDIRKE